MSLFLTFFLLRASYKNLNEYNTGTVFLKSNLVDTIDVQDILRRWLTLINKSFLHYLKYNYTHINAPKTQVALLRALSDQSKI